MVSRRSRLVGTTRITNDEFSLDASMTNLIPDTRPLSPTARVHVSGICGTGTGALASLLSTMGIRVRGSDDHVYPPMSTFLAERAVSILEGYRAEHLADRPDWVVIGNALSRDNPECRHARDLKRQL